MAVTFGDLKTRISGETNRTSATEVSAMGDAIVTAIKFYDKRRLWFTEENTSLTLTEGSNYVALPDNFRGLIKLRVLVNGRYRGEKEGFVGVPYDRMKESATDPDETGEPTMFSLFKGRIYVPLLTDQEYTLDLAYVKGDTSYPSVTGDISVWTGDEAVDLIRYKALAIFYRDFLHAEEKAAVYDGEADKIFNNLLLHNNTREIYNLTLDC